jgi:hypothetical protein
LLVAAPLLAKIPAVPTSEEYRRAVAVPVASVEAINAVDVGLSAKCPTPPATLLKLTGMPGFTICTPY